MLDRSVLGIAILLPMSEATAKATGQQGAQFGQFLDRLFGEQLGDELQYSLLSGAEHRYGQQRVQPGVIELWSVEVMGAEAVQLGEPGQLANDPPGDEKLAERGV